MKVYLRDLAFSSAREVEVTTNKKAIIIMVRFPPALPASGSAKLRPLRVPTKVPWRRPHLAGPPSPIHRMSCCDKARGTCIASRSPCSMSARSPTLYTPRGGRK